MILRDRKLNIAPAIKKQTFCAPNETIYYTAATHPGLINNIPIEQFPPAAAAALYSPGGLSSFISIKKQLDCERERKRMERKGEGKKITISFLSISSPSISLEEMFEFVLKLFFSL